MTGWLEGKRGLVVGAGSGIGRAVVDAFRAEGARVAVLERNRDKCDALREQLPDVPVVDGDATTREANDRAVTPRRHLRGPRHPRQLRRNIRLLYGHNRYRRRRSR